MGENLTPLIYVFAFLAVIIGVQSVAQLVFSARDRDRQVNRRLSMLESGVAPDRVYASLVRRPVQRLVQYPGLAGLQDRIGLYCRQAGLDVTLMKLVAFVGAGAAILWLFSLYFLRSGEILNVIVSGTFSLIVSFIISGLAAWVWLSRRRIKQFRVLEDQLPVALDVINRAIRAGHPVVSAVQLAAGEMGDPIGSEFGLIVDETTYGLEFREALMNFARRTGSPDAYFFAVSVSVQSTTGGNLAEILAGLASVIRGRSTLSKRVKALSSEGRASALLLSALPIFLIGFMMLTNAGFYTTKFSDPIFWPTVIIVSIVYMFGLVLIRRIINFKY